MLQRVQKIIANAGICSRRKAEQLIEREKVKVNGKVIKIGTSADPDKDQIVVDGKLLKRQKKLYLAFFKPGDCLTTLDDPRGRKTIFDYIHIPDRVIPVGRLDFRTEGLLLLTNDGEFANFVMHPRYEVEKIYMVTLDRPFSLEDLRKLKKGVEVKDSKGNIVRVDNIKASFADQKRYVLEIRLHQGQNRIVRKIMESFDYKVKRLIRVKVGCVELGTLKKGKHRKLNHSEISWFLKNAKKVSTK